MKSIWCLALFLLSAVSVHAETFKVGVTLPLSGFGVEYGTAGKNGFLFAKEEHPELFQNIEFLFEDNQYSSKASLSAFRKLTDVHQVHLIHSWGEVPTLSIAPLAEKQKVPVVFLGTDSRPSVEEEFLISFYNPAELYSLRMLEYLRKKGLKKIAVFQNDDPYCERLVEGFKRNLRADESLTIVANVGFEDQDFRSQLLRVKKGDFDVVANLLFPGQVQQYYKQATQLHIQIPSFGFDVFASATEREAAGEGIIGAVAAYQAVRDDFRKRYKARFGNDVFIVYAASSYELALLIGEFFGSKAATGFSPQKIISRFKLQVPRDTVFGAVRYEEHPRFGKFFRFPLHLFRVTAEGLKPLPE